jgi:hypothetical protein
VIAGELACPTVLQHWEGPVLHCELKEVKKINKMLAMMVSNTHTSGVGMAAARTARVDRTTVNLANMVDKEGVGVW